MEQEQERLLHKGMHGLEQGLVKGTVQRCGTNHQV